MYLYVCIMYVRKTIIIYSDLDVLLQKIGS